MKLRLVHMHHLGFLFVVWYTRQRMEQTARQSGTHALVALLLCGAAVAVSLLHAHIAIPVLFIALLIATLSRFSRAVFFIMVALIPFIGLTVTISEIPPLANIPILGNWDAPLSDFIALPLLLIYGYSMFKKEKEQTIQHHIEKHLPAIGVYGAFLLVAGMTIFRAPEIWFGQSVQYFVRFVLFSYLAYVALPFWMTKTKEDINTIVKIISGVGIALMVYGAISLLVNEPFWGVWRRVSPFSFGDMFPVGPNHNQLAEVLIYSAPFTWFMSRQTQGQTHKWWVIATFALIATALLTFARTAWIAIFVQGVVMYRLLQPRGIRERIIEWWPLLVGIVGISVYMTVFTASDLVASSTATRLDLTRISLHQFTKTPFLGNGIGTFLPSISNSYVFQIEYGGGVEAHGFIQKLLFETGIIGLALFSFFFAYILANLVLLHRKQMEGYYKDLLATATLALLGTFVYQIFNTSYFSPKLWFLVGFACIVWYGNWKFSRI